MIKKIIVSFAVMAAAADAACYPLGLPTTGCVPPISPCNPVIPDLASFAAAYSAAVPSCLSPLAAPFGYPAGLSPYGSGFGAPFGLSSCLSGLGAYPAAPYLTGCY